MNIPEELNTAITCARIAADIYKQRPWFINLSRNGVFVFEEFFHDIFKTWYVEEALEDNEYHCFNVDGVKVYCLVQKEEKDALDG